MPQSSPVDRLQVPLGGQEIVLDEIIHDGGGMKMLRVRIRERSRFTVFDIDPMTAMRWGAAMVRWGEAQPDATDGPAE
jgi:hypothetical protein